VTVVESVLSGSTFRDTCDNEDRILEHTAENEKQAVYLILAFAEVARQD